ncbi:EmrA/EmrK family multidrug efflux transporter periplasmic adaptor subunit, partial [Salmonella enterica subsp. enterica serovar Larochelle]|nr:EmrA/EmrK family multidrug efflux transporter periplasmic adaptor subunit [Salmonella enterica subsp. enterica serovar Larochelle]
MTEDKDKNGPQDMDRAPDNTNAKPDSGDKKKHRRKLFALFGGVLILIAIGYAIWLIFFAGKSV